MKEKEESAKAGLHGNTRKTKLMTPEETHNFNIDNEDIKIVKGFAYLGSVLNSNEFPAKYSREWVKTRKGSNGKIRKGHQEQKCVIVDQG